MRRGLAAMAVLAAAAQALAAPPAGWQIAGSAPRDYEFTVDPQTPFAGHQSASIAATPQASSSGFGTLMQTVRADDFRGGRWRLSGYLKTSDARRVQMWMRVDGPRQEVLAFDNMDSRPITGTTGWTRYEIVLDVPSQSLDVAFGFLLAQGGRVWAGKFSLDKVADSVATTGREQSLPRQPQNLDFLE